MRSGLLKSELAQRKKAIEDFEKDMMSLIKTNRENIKEFYEDTWNELVKQEKDNSKFMADVWKLLGLEQKDLGLQVNKDILDTNKKGIKAIQEDNKNANKLDLDQRQRRIDAIKQGLNELLQFTQSIADREVEITQRRRELLDTQIAELQRALETEARLYEAGYASNVTLKQKELADLKKQRDQALKDEEEALLRQRRMETIAQGVSIFSAATNILKEYTKLGPIGLILAAGAITSMFAILASVKKRSSEMTQLEKGGSGTDTGMITGKSHARGGERFTDNIEVEHGEAWGVLSVPASQKFGKIFHHMVSSFNKGEIPTIHPVNKINNRVMVENSGPNSRLDQVIKEQRRLNEKLSGNESVQELANARVIRKENSIRIIKR